jgi:hypothetical protein
MSVDALVIADLALMLDAAERDRDNYRELACVWLQGFRDRSVELKKLQAQHHALQDQFRSFRDAVMLKAVAS